MERQVDERILELIGQLESLQRGEEAAGRLVACGRAAVEPLRHYLLEGRPSSVAQPRCWAVQALAGIGATDVLIDYLRYGRTTSDPVLRFAEETVQRTAALALAADRTEEVFQLLLEFTAKHPVAGVIEALGEFERREAVPVLLDACEDDFCRPWALTALARVAERNRDLLIDSVLTPTFVDGEERPRSVRRRRALVELLRSVSLQPDDIHRLSGLINAEDPELAIQGAVIAMSSEFATDVERGRRRLNELAPIAPSFLAGEVRQLTQGSDRHRKSGRR